MACAVFANRKRGSFGGHCPTVVRKLGAVAEDFTVTELAERAHWVVSGRAVTRFHQRFSGGFPAPQAPHSKNWPHLIQAFKVVAPDTFNLLSRNRNFDVRNDAFLFFHSAQMIVTAIEYVATRISPTGDLGWESHYRHSGEVDRFAFLL